MKKLLIVIDMQNDFITGSLANSEAEKILPKVAELIKGFDGEVIFTQDTHTSSYLETNEGKHLPTKHCIQGTFGYEIHSDLTGLHDFGRWQKNHFGSYELMWHLEDLLCGEWLPDVEIHFCGTVSEICVISNVLLAKTAFPSSKIIVHKSCCAGLDEKGHEAAMLVMERCQCEIEE